MKLDHATVSVLSFVIIRLIVEILRRNKRINNRIRLFYPVLEYLPFRNARVLLEIILAYYFLNVLKNDVILVYKKNFVERPNVINYYSIPNQLYLVYKQHFTRNS